MFSIPERCLPLILATMSWCPWWTCSGSELVRSKVYVPVRWEHISEVRLGGKSYPVKALQPGWTAPGVVLADGGNCRPVYETLLYLEVLTALSDLGGNKMIEFWGSGGSGDYLAGGQFPDGWLFTPTAKPSNRERAELLPVTLVPDIVRQLARRFAGCGPVRVFWLRQTYTWLDRRGSEDRFASPFDGDFELIGDAGLMLYPIVLPGDGDPASARKESTWARWGTWTLGGSPRPVVDRSGRTLIDTIRESDRGTVLTIEIPSRQYDWRSMPKKLEVIGKQGRVLYSRPFVVGGSTRPNCGEADKDFRFGLYRIAPKLGFVGHSVGGACFEKQAPDGKRFVLLNGVRQACARCEVNAEAVVSYRGSGVSRLSSRALPIQYVQRGTEACLGPLEVKPGALVTVHSAEQGWLASVEIQ